MYNKEILLAKAIKMAVSAHGGQFDKSGMPYICHPLRVMDGVRHISLTHMIVAVLHDVVEDTPLKLRKIHKIFGDIIGNAVDALTKRKEETYKEYLERVKQNHIAKAVKVRDLQDNMLFERLEKLPMKTREYLTLKYSKALIYL